MAFDGVVTTRGGKKRLVWHVNIDRSFSMFPPSTDFFENDVTLLAALAHQKKKKTKQKKTQSHLVSQAPECSISEKETTDSFSLYFACSRSVHPRDLIQHRIRS